MANGYLLQKFLPTDLAMVRFIGSVMKQNKRLAKLLKQLPALLTPMDLLGKKLVTYIRAT
jgi:hypothetical protein